jgi:hypothetical protein
MLSTPDNNNHDVRLHDVTWLRAMYVDAHSSVQRIAVLTSTTDGVVEHALVRAGIALRDQPGRKTRYPSLFDDEFVIEAFAGRGLCIRELAREVGCSEQRVHDVLRRPGLRDRLAAAGWDAGAAANRLRSSRTPDKQLPSTTEVLALLSSQGDVLTRGQLHAMAGVGRGQYGSFNRRLEQMASDGVIVIQRSGPNGRKIEIIRPDRD